MKNLVFKNKIFTKKELKQTMYQIFTDYGLSQASSLADDLKSLGFRYATQAGISISIEDLKITPTKSEILDNAIRDIENSNTRFNRGEISTIERFQNIINIWNNTSESIKDSLVDYFAHTDPLNSIYLMAFSGARGNLSQVRQLVGMRGLMSDPNGQIIDIPIIHNFREGLTITDYIMSSYGARKGVVDTALKTADSGYLTRRLVDVSQDVIIREFDCYTKRFISFDLQTVNSKSLENKLVGRTCASDFKYYNKSTKNWTELKANTQITKQTVNDLASSYFTTKLYLRSPLTCELMRSVCQLCYGWNLASGKLVNLGDAIGILAAQSIGEPGTQLTMRTFHTGGIFTADPSRQIRAQVSGLLSTSNDLKFSWARTSYGTTIRLLNQESKFLLISYSNQRLTFSLPAQTSVFVDPNQFVKKNQLIGELPLTNQQLLKAKKEIVAPISGEIVTDFDNDVVWILQGNVYETPYQSLLNLFHEYSIPLTQQDIIANYKFISATTGIVKYNSISERLVGLQIFNGIGLSPEKVFFDRNLNLFFLITPTFTIYQIPFAYFSSRVNYLDFQAAQNFQYFVPTNGNIYHCDSQKGSIKSNAPNSSRILYVPFERYTINRDRSLLLVYPGTELTESNTEIIKGKYSRYPGLVETQEADGILKEITIKPGKFIEYIYLEPTDVQYLMSLNNKIFYPGEILFEDILVEYLSLVEFISTPSTVGLLIRPLFDYNLPKFPQKDLFLITNNLALNTRDIRSDVHDSLDTSSTQNGGYLIQNKCSLLFFDAIKCQFLNFGQPFATLSLVNEDVVSFQKILPKQFTYDQIYLNLSVENFQFVDKKAVLGFLSTRLNSNVARNFKKVAIQNNGLRKVLFTTRANYISYYSESPIFDFKTLRFLKCGDKLAKNYEVRDSGFIVQNSPFFFTLHRGTPIFLKNEEGIRLDKASGNFIKSGEVLGLIHYSQIITGDIVQGLPKIEEILEARRPSDSAQLAPFSGLIQSIKYFPNDKKIILNTKSRWNKNYEVNLNKSNTDLIVNELDYLVVGQPLTVGSINPHDLLDTFFSFYKCSNAQYEAAYLSFKNLQILLINKIQQVYSSQGVDIADKHLEIIVRQMTSKVRVTNPGSTLLVENETLDLCQVRYINKIMAIAHYPQAQYAPRLLGITKASLLTDSFISAASFQETTKILTAAAIEGKVDWLRGLKENVIIGRLIPVGKGFNPPVESHIKELTFY